MRVAPGFKGDSLPVVPGKLYGLRAFDINQSEGTLRGVTYPEKWTSGENVATCKHKSNKRRPHSIKECDHGYWSYFGATTNFMDRKRATAVIEGYGEVVIGEEGFRSQKAKIAAVVLPDAGYAKNKPKTVINKDTMKRVRDNARKDFWRVLVFLIFFLSVPTMMVGHFMTSYEFQQVALGTFGIVFTSLLYPMTSLGLSWRKASQNYNNYQEGQFDNAQDSSSKEESSSPEVSEPTDLKGLVQSNYPDVVIYSSLGEMLRDYQGKILIHGSVLSASADKE